MTNPRQTLPDFEDPPVVETAVAVEFTPLPKWTMPYFGLFWREIDAEYPRSEVKEAIGADAGRVYEAAEFPIRCWFLTDSGEHLVQVQKNRFIHNWRKVTGTEQYPHFRNILPAFENAWVRFREFLAIHDLGVPDVQHCEVTYVNHIERGKGWQSLADLGSILPAWASQPTSEFLPTPDAVALKVLYSMPNEDGQLEIQLQPGIRNTDGKEILQLLIAARSRPASSDLSDLLECLSRGQEWVVRGFADFTSKQMHDLWKRRPPQ